MELYESGIRNANCNCCLIKTLKWFMWFLLALSLMTHISSCCRLICVANFFNVKCQSIRIPQNRYIIPLSVNQNLENVLLPSQTS